MASVAMMRHRTVYNRSHLFDAPSRVMSPAAYTLVSTYGDLPAHLYMRLWAAWCTAIAFNDQYGDYGRNPDPAAPARWNALSIPYTVMLACPIFRKLSSGQYVSIGQEIAHFGKPAENGHWPPHLHFQVIFDMELKEGDYPGVCKYSEREKYLANCPDPDLILQLMRYAK